MQRERLQRRLGIEQQPQLFPALVRVVLEVGKEAVEPGLMERWRGLDIDAPGRQVPQQIAWQVPVQWRGHQGGVEIRVEPVDPLRWPPRRERR